MKLTPKQKEVVKDLKEGGILITDNTIKGAQVAFHKGAPKKDYHINNAAFWNLVDKGMIFQELQWPFEYILTDEAEKLKL